MNFYIKSKFTISNMKGLMSWVTACLALPVWAIENPIPEPLKSAQASRKGGSGLGAKHKENAYREIAALGVGGSPVSKATAAQLDIAYGRGIVLRHVGEGSAAEKAGLKIYDILTGFNEHLINSQHDLRVAVRSFSPGDEVKLTYLHKGQEMTASTKLDARTVQLEASDVLDAAASRGVLDDVPLTDRHVIEQQMRKHIAEMEKHLNGQGGMEMEILRLLDKVSGSTIPPSGGIQDKLPPSIGNIKKPKPAKNMQFSSTSTVTKRDQAGSVTMKSRSGIKEIIVKGPRGKVVFEGPYQTDEDRRAVPSDVARRIEQMNFNVDCDIRLHVDPSK